MRINEAVWLEKYSRWQINVQKEGIRKTFSSYTEGKKGKREAEHKADEWLEKGIISGNVRFWAVYIAFLEEKRLLSSNANYKTLLTLGSNWLKPTLEHNKLSSITCQQWQDCINKAYKAGRSKKTLKNIRGAITNFRRYAKKCGYALKECEDIEIPKNAPTKEKRILQPNDLKELFNPAHDDNYYIHAFRFLVLTGLRRGELCALRREHIKDGVCYIRQSLNNLGELTGGKNENARRYFILSPMQQACINAQYAMLKDLGIISPYVFCNKNGNIHDSNYLFKKWKEFSTSIGINCTLHELRHTFISIHQCSLPEQTLKRVVGHSKSMDTFGIYGHLVEGDLERAADTIDNTFKTVLNLK